jgi:hypothetical protein
MTKSNYLIILGILGLLLLVDFVEGPMSKNNDQETIRVLENAFNFNY